MDCALEDADAADAAAATLELMAALALEEALELLVRLEVAEALTFEAPPPVEEVFEVEVVLLPPLDPLLSLLPAPHANHVQEGWSPMWIVDVPLSFSEMKSGTEVQC